VGEGLGFQRTQVSSSPSPSPPFICAQRDGGPQPSVGWRPRSGREIKRARDSDGEAMKSWRARAIGLTPTGVQRPDIVLGVSLNGKTYCTVFCGNSVFFCVYFVILQAFDERNVQNHDLNKFKVWIFFM
jgi:hypothetical protein